MGDKCRFTIWLFINTAYMQDIIYRKLGISISGAVELSLCGLKLKLEKRTNTLVEVVKWAIEQISSNKRDIKAIY